jgi:hypothetical protein
MGRMGLTGSTGAEGKGKSDYWAYGHAVESSEAPLPKVVTTAGSTTVEHWFNELEVPQQVAENTHFPDSVAVNGATIVDDYPSV